MICPSDDSLREILDASNADTSSTEVLFHLADCSACKSRVASFGLQRRLEDVLRDFRESPPVIDVMPAVMDAMTNSYTGPSRRRIGQYELLRSIGRGGGGEVFEARHALLQRRVAIKLLSARHVGDESARRRFFREMESIGQLNDPYIVRAYDAGEVDGTLYLAMELVEGENLESLARRVGQLPVSDACEIIRQAAIGLQHVHETGLVHRDLKPSNLLLSKTGLKIADLGLALLNRNGLTEDRLTGHHTVLGTADYMAPEQAEGSHHVDIRADLYSLGCTLFRLLSGRAPFAVPENSTPIKKMMAHASQPIPDILQMRPDVPIELALLIRRLLAKDRNDRFAEPRDLAEAIRPFCHAEDLPSLVLTKPTPPGAQGSSSTGRDPTDRQQNSSRLRLREIADSTFRWLRNPATIGIAVVAIAVASSRWWWPMNVSPTNGANAESEARSGPVPAIVKSDTSVAVVVPTAMPAGPTTDRWQHEFGVLPVEMTWERNSGVGTWRIDEDLKSLVLQANKSCRLVKLGDISRRTEDFKLSLDVVHQSNSGECGVFFGFQPEKSDNPRFVRFQAITIRSFNAIDGPKLLVQRNLRQIAIPTGDVSSDRNHHVQLSDPKGKAALSMEIQFEAGQLNAIKVAGQDCDQLTSSSANSQFSDTDFDGPFGVFTFDASVWFSNPNFQRKLP